MKSSSKTAVLRLLTVVLWMLCGAVLAQAPPPPPNSGSKGDATNKAPGGGAPIGTGVGLTLALIAGFGAWKYVARRHPKSQPS